MPTKSISDLLAAYKGVEEFEDVQFVALFQRHLERVADAMIGGLGVLKVVTESPIELLLGTHLMFGVPSFVGTPSACATDLPDRFVVRPQHEIGPYRVDFAVWLAMGTLDLSKPYAGVKIAVECDGHAFHEKTKEQAARDKSRDRFLVSEGWRVMRFTGREIYLDPAACAAQVFTTIENLADLNPNGWDAE